MDDEQPIGWSRGYARRNGETSSTARFDTEQEAIQDALDCAGSGQRNLKVIACWVRPVYPGLRLGRTTWEWRWENGPKH